jgi:tripartite-type tricarboxylate transporter receptor subunit TctC
MKNSTMPSRRVVIAALLATAALVETSPARAAWPDKPITLVVGYAAGGSVDAVARLVSTPLSKRLGQPIVIENTGGAGGALGATRVAKAPADGYTLMVGSGSEVAIAWATNPNLKYNGLTDLAPVGLISTSPMVLVGNNTVAAPDMAGLLQYGKANRGKLSLATSGVGTPQHLLLEYVNRKAGADILHVPYRSAASIVQDVIGGRVDLSILTLSTAQPFIASGQLRAYAVTGDEPAAALPGVPAITKSPALKGEVFDLWFGMLAPAGVPAGIIARVNTELNEVLKQPEVREALVKQGMSVAAGTPAQFGAYIKADSQKYQKIIKEAGIVVN